MESGDSEQVASVEKPIWNFLPKQISPYLFVLIVVCLIAFFVEVYFVSQIKFVGYTDPARFADVAENLLKGNGFKLDTIGNYFLKFQTVTHPEEYSFPLISIIIAPFLLLFGKTAFAVKLPQMLAFIIFIPIVTYFLGKELFDERIGFLSAISMIFLPLTFTIGFFGQRDPLFTLFALLSFYFYISALKNQKYFYYMGACLGLSFLAKPTGIFLFGILLFSQYFSQRKLSAHFLKGLLLGVLIITPWLVRNFLVFGSPLFSASRYDMYLYGYGGYYEPDAYKIYWDIAKPSFDFVLREVGINGFLYKIVATLANQVYVFIYLMVLTFAGILLSQRKKLWHKLVYFYIFSISGIFIIDGFLKYFLSSNTFLLASLSFFYLMALVTSIVILNKNGISAVILFPVSWIAFSLFSSILWGFDIRFFLIIVPFLLIFSWKGIEELIQLASEKISLKNFDIEKILIAILAVLIIMAIPQTFGHFLKESSGYPYNDDNRTLSIIQMADRINTETGPEDTIMGCHIESMHFYNGRKAVQLPAASNLGEVTKIIKTYNVTYLSMYGCDRRLNTAELYSFTNGEILPPAGFEYKLYRVNIG